VNADHPLVGWFLDEVGALDEDQQRQLLQFWSGSPVVPVHGFAVPHDGFAWTLDVQVDGDVSLLPTASTCSYLLRMPPYPDQPTLAAKLRIAIASGAAGFDNH
jgi:ubiquitin-protein ligase E3 C